MRKIPYFHLISWCRNFVERHSFSIVSGESPETMRKLCLSAKFLHQEIRWNYGFYAVEYAEKTRILAYFTQRSVYKSRKHFLAPAPPPKPDPCARKCKDGTCISSDKVCDFFVDCAAQTSDNTDTTDEDNCDGCDFEKGMCMFKKILLTRNHLLPLQVCHNMSSFFIFFSLLNSRVWSIFIV